MWLICCFETGSNSVQAFTCYFSPQMYTIDICISFPGYLLVIMPRYVAHTYPTHIHVSDIASDKVVLLRYGRLPRNFLERRKGKENRFRTSSHAKRSTHLKSSSHDCLGTIPLCQRRPQYSNRHSYPRPQ